MQGMLKAKDDFCNAAIRHGIPVIDELWGGLSVLLFYSTRSGLPFTVLSA
jgi:hypothetical protein